MPKEAKVFVAEDDKMWLAIIRRGLARAGHTIVSEATSFQEAIRNVELAREKEVNVGVIDGSLSGDDPTDGPRIAKALRKEIPDIKIVSFSGDPVDWGDANLGKENGFQLPEIVTEL